MDDKFTEKVRQWLDTPAQERDIIAGATLLLQLNKNRILHANIVRHPERFMGKLEYELRKHLNIRVDGFTLSAVVRMEREVMPAVALTLDKGVPAEPSTDEGEQKRRARGAVR